MKIRPFYKALALALLTTPSIGFAATADGGDFIGKGAAMVAPRGYTAMCQRDTTACGTAKAESKQASVANEASWQYRKATGAIGCDLTDPAIAGPDYVRPLGMSRTSAPVNSKWNVTEKCSSLSSGANVEDAVTASGNSSELAKEHELLAEVNRTVNAHVRQLTDRQIYGVDEYWTRSTLDKSARGDCEDLALEKQHELLGRGFDPNRMFLAVVYRSHVGLHTVLVARLADGDFVLDSRTPYINRWTETAYSWVVVQDPANPNFWYKPVKS